ncbi:MAG: Rrf2 family transcriptional regulator [Planctomycetes bacterium]|nr:Rrf2 family transcriptional regulator [Planctomycetota bacterium]
MISKSASYALRAMVELAQLPPGVFASSARISRTCDTPPKYLSKLMEILADAKLIRSQKGLRGGYALARPSDNITLFEIIEAIDHISRLPGCLFGHERCSDRESCPAHQRWQEVRGALLRMLSETTLSELLPTRQSSPPLPGR